MKDKSIAIIGAGPVGLEAALCAMERGYKFTVYECGRVADAVRQWGYVRMFSPFGMNASSRGLAHLQVRGYSLPDRDELLSGAEFRERYLLPLAESLRPHLREGCFVQAIGRARRLKGDFIGQPQRDLSPFRLLLRDKNGEHVELAEIVLDCSGTFGQPNSLGEGIPVPGERECSAHISRGMPILGDDNLDRFAGKHVLVVGAGHSAATVIRDLAAMDGTKLSWMIRSARAIPILEVPNDSLPERARLTRAANDLVQTGRARLLSGASIERIAPSNGRMEVRWSDPVDRSHSLVVDEIVAATGFRPDLELTRELQVQTCWATEGTYPLAASLLGEAGADCLATPVFGAETLLHPEPGYFTLGMKSYGRNSNFLLRTGYEQVVSVFDWLERKMETPLQ